MQPRRSHAVVAAISAAGAAVALTWTLVTGDLRSPGALLFVVLLANATVRYRLARR